MRKNRCPVLKNLHFSFRTFTIMIMTILVGSLKRGFSECPLHNPVATATAECRSASILYHWRAN